MGSVRLYKVLCELKRIVRIQRDGRVPLIKANLLLASYLKGKIEMYPGHAALGANGIWYENSYTFQFQSLMERGNPQNAPQPIDQGK